MRGSAPDTRVFDAGRPHQLHIGSAPGSELVLPATCAAPLQLEVFWDGDSLWLQDRLRLGSTLVQGRPLAEWTLIRGQVLVAFNKVRLWLAAASPSPAPSAPNLTWLDQVRGGSARRAQRMPTLRFSESEISEVRALIEAAGS
ncbi:MAG TPA: FHA domain-containing protein [Polyangiales bacterium]